MLISLFVLISLLLGSMAVPDISEARLRHAPRVKRVIGGVDVEKGQWPWLVSLKGKVPIKVWNFWGWIIPLEYRNYYCGGSVLNKRWVLTAAHCFYAKGAPDRIRTPKYWHAKVGEVEVKHTAWDSIRDAAGRVFNKGDWRMWYVHAEKIIIHPQYSSKDNWKHDIALIRLEKDLPVGSADPHISEVELPTASDRDWPTAGTDCVMKGWGCTSKGGSLSSSAKSVLLPVVQDQICRAFYGDITGTRMCAGYNLMNKGICQGDSGGPLVCKKGSGWMQAGIASFTSANRPGQVPAAFTEVSHYISWIQNNIKN